MNGAAFAVDSPAPPSLLNGSRFPERIVCCTEETTEILYRIGAGDRVVGVSGFTVRPPEARRKPKISAFISAKIDDILALRPDLVLTFSDLQADITANLIKHGVAVYCFNQRSVVEILQTIRIVSALVGLAQKGEALADELSNHLRRIAEASAGWPRSPRVYFEEWPDPLISGIRWVSELIQIAGGVDIFAELQERPLAKDRIVASEEVVRRDPEIIIGSWCGRKFRPEKVKQRREWEGVAAVRSTRIHEIKSSIILQPGPAALSEGVDQLHAIIKRTFAGSE